MPERLWKHLPYAVYLDTNAVRSAGTFLETLWIGELLAITKKYGISVCISDVVLSEWCEHIQDILKGNRDKIFSSARVLTHFGAAVPAIKPSDVSLPDKSELVAIVTRRLHDAGIDVIADFHPPLAQLLTEAVVKVAPFEPGGKGLCDAVILESYAMHAKEQLPGKSVLVVSDDRAVKRSAERFKRQGIDVTFVKAVHIVTRLKGLLDDEVKALINEDKVALENYISEHRDEILEFVRKTPLEITDSLLYSLYRARGEAPVAGTIEGIEAVRPTRVVGAFYNPIVFQHRLSNDRCPIGVTVELEIDVIARDYGFQYADFLRSRATVQPDSLDGIAPVPLESRRTSATPQYGTTIKSSITVLASIDAVKKEQSHLEDFKIEAML